MTPVPQAEPIIISPEKSLTPVRIEKVTPDRIDGPLRFTATVNPYTQVSLEFKVDGYVREIARVKGADGRMRDIQERDEVEKDTPIAKVEERGDNPVPVSARDLAGARPVRPGHADLSPLGRDARGNAQEAGEQIALTRRSVRRIDHRDSVSRELKP